MFAATSQCFFTNKNKKLVRTVFHPQDPTKTPVFIPESQIHWSQDKCRKKKRGFKGPGTLHSKDSLQKNMSGLEQLLDTFSGNKAKAYGLHFLYKEIWVGTLWDPRCNNKYGYLTRLGRRRQNISVFT